MAGYYSLTFLFHVLSHANDYSKLLLTIFIRSFFVTFPPNELIYHPQYIDDWYLCEHISTYSFVLIILKLCMSCLLGMRMCMVWK